MKKKPAKRSNLNALLNDQVDVNVYLSSLFDPERPMNTKESSSRKRCPGCKFDKTYVGTYCPSCTHAGLPRPKSDEIQAFVNACVRMVEEIYSDTRRLLEESGERITNKAMIETLTEMSMEQVDFRGSVKYPVKAKYEDVEKKLRSAIKARYF